MALRPAHRGGRRRLGTVRLDGPRQPQDRRPSCARCRPRGCPRTPPSTTTRSCSPGWTSPPTSSTRRSWPSSVTAGNLLFCSMLGYALAMLDFRGKNVIFVAVLGTLMIPGVVTFVPLFVLVANAGPRRHPAGAVPAVPRGPVRGLPHAAVHPRAATRPARRGPGRRCGRAAHLRPDHPAAVRAGTGDPRHPHVPRELEQLPLAARRGADRGLATRCPSPWPCTPRARTPRTTASCSPGRPSS